MEEIVDGQVGQHATMLQVQHTAGQAFDLAQVVAAEQQRHAGLCGEGGHQCFDLAFGGRVEAGSGLIKQQHIRLQRPGTRHGQALLLAAGQGARVALRQGRQAHLLQRLQRPGFGHRPACAAQPQGQRHVALAAGTQHVRALEQHGLVRVCRAAVQLAAAGRDQAVQHPQQGAFATAVGAHQSDTFPRMDAECGLAQRLHSAERHVHGAQIQQGGSGVHACTPRHAGWGSATLPSSRSRQRRTMATSRFSSSTTASSTRPSAMASGRSPLLVSSAMAVVITRV